MGGAPDGMSLPVGVPDAAAAVTVMLSRQNVPAGPYVLVMAAAAYADVPGAHTATSEKHSAALSAKAASAATNGARS